MPSFVVDPLLCTTPGDAAGPDETRRWLDALDAWLVAVEGSPFAWRHVLACTQALQENGRFPDFTSLRAAREAAGSEVNIAGLLRRLSRFFQDEARDLVAETATKCAVVAEPEPRITPPTLLDRNLPEIRGPFRDALLCLACDKAAREPFAADARLVTRSFPEPADQVVIAGTIDLIDPEEMTRRLAGQALAQAFPAVFSPDALAEWHYEELLEAGEAHLSALIKSIAEATYPGQRLLPFSLGSKLWRSLEDVGILENRGAIEKLLKIIAAIVAGRWRELNVDRRDLRESEAADSPQRTRKSDSAKAWRVTVTKEGAGYRMHYWHRSARAGVEEAIELANVLRERDPKVIPEQ